MKSLNKLLGVKQMLRQILTKSLFLAAAPIHLHNQHTFKQLYNYYANNDKLGRNEILKLFVGTEVNDDKSLSTIIPDHLTFKQFAVLYELLSTPRRRLLLAFKTLDVDGNQILTKDELSAISVVEKDMSFKDFQSWLEKLQETFTQLKFKTHSEDGKISGSTVSKLINLVKPLPKSISKNGDLLASELLNSKEFSDIWKILNESEKLHDVLAFLGPKNIDLPLFSRAINAAASSSGFTVAPNTSSFLFSLLDVDKSGHLDSKEIINFFESHFDARSGSKLVHCFNQAKESLEF
eukprot:NODE_445_length_7306_cov_0.516997.p4 type:complete len:293 gc:universal NODE_445_length_7306_cov_0.516997:343-1221(+)